jgi:hypothetical protein
MDVALTEYSRLLETYPSLGYEVLILAKNFGFRTCWGNLNTLEA